MKYVPFYNELKTDRDDCYFIGLNSADGFRWADPYLFSENKLQRLYIIKGAAGTGKSTLLRKIADECADSGNPVRRYLCSSDPSSYDGIVIDGKVALVDGTAPHVTEMKYPGAVSEIVNLANFWDVKKLISKSDEIISVSVNKTVNYERAYKALKAIRVLTGGMYSEVRGCINVGKAEKAVKRLVGSLKNGVCKGSTTNAVINSIGMRGRFKLDTLKKKAEKVISVDDRYGSSYCFLDILKETLIKEGYEIFVSPDPLYSCLVSDVYIPSARLLITNEIIAEPFKNVNMERFLDFGKLKGIKGSVRLSAKCAEQLVSDAERSLKDAGTYHFSLEKIYGDAMNFEALNEYTKLLTRNILCELQ